jgi:mono/diheme cytochrome c family protein
MRSFKLLSAVSVGAALAWGCGGSGTTLGNGGGGALGTGGAPTSTQPGTGGVTTTSSSVSGTGGAQADGLPCDVEAVLQTHCWSCHGATPSGGAPNALLTRADLAAPSPSDPTKSNAVMAMARMVSTSSPMPPKPAPAVSPAERAAFGSWVNAGMPAGTCGGTGGTGTGGTGTGGAGGDPYNTPPTCSSNTYWTNGDSGSANMHPGKACRTCHVIGGKATGKTFDVAGTVYLTAHEPDDCNGVSVSGAQVIITDAQGNDHPLAVNGAGNFNHNDLFGFGAFSTPYKARVVYNGKTRAMSAPQTSGDCNGCHTEGGASGAPGRIMLP